MEGSPTLRDSDVVMQEHTTQKEDRKVEEGSKVETEKKTVEGIYHSENPGTKAKRSTFQRTLSRWRSGSTVGEKVNCEDFSNHIGKRLSDGGFLDNPEPKEATS
jgi:hypothetical protein